MRAKHSLAIAAATAREFSVNECASVWCAGSICSYHRFTSLYFLMACFSIPSLIPHLSVQTIYHVEFSPDPSASSVAKGILPRRP